MDKSNKNHLSNTDLIFFQIERNQLKIIQDLAVSIWPITFKNILTKDQIDYMLNWMYSIEKLTSCFEKGDNFYLLQIQNKCVGYVHVEMINPEKIKIQKIYLLPNFHGIGLGKFMLNQVVLVYRKLNFHLIELQVNRSNPAVEFYLNYGFKISDSTDFDIGHGFFMNDFIMHFEI